MNIAVIGVGGVGGYFGAKICRAMEALNARVYFVARGAHLAAIRNNGLTLRTSSEGTIRCRPTLATSDVDELPVLDAGLICVKSYDLDALARRLGSRVSAGTEIVPLQNGIDIYERIRANLRGGKVHPGCVFIGTHIEEPGVVVQDGGACTILFGNTQQEPAGNAPIMTRVFAQGSIRSEWRDDIRPALWSKYLFIAPFGMVTAGFDKTLGQVMESAELSSLVRSIMQEVLALATALGVLLPESIVEDSYRKGGDFPPHTRTSFQRDFEDRGRLDERDLFSAAMIRLGERLGIATPRAREMERMINGMKPWPREARSAR